MPTDPVCGMFVPEGSDLFSVIDGRTYYFCSKTCQLKYSSPEEEGRKLKRRLALAWLLSIPILAINYLVPSSYLHGSENRNILMLLLTLPVQFYSGLGFYNGAYHAIKSMSGNMDLLISMGTLTAFVYSSIVVISGGTINGGSVFFDASAFIITLILTGNYLENMTKSRANRAAGKLQDLIPGTSHLVDTEGNVNDVKTDTLRVGDVILIRPGEAIPADGSILDGKSEIDESMLTGEQAPALRMTGNMVTSGTLNLNGLLKVKITRTGKDSTVSQIYELIQGAISGRAKVLRVADTFSAVFVPVVIVSALISSLSWYFYLSISGYTGAVEISILVFVSVVVIACPCAIGLAGPIALLISSSRASESGIIIKNTGSLDRLSKVNVAVFDKTGTLTEPDPAISKIELAGDFTMEKILSFAASVETHSNHPIARAVVKEAEKLSLSLEECRDVGEIPGKGISGIVGGKEVDISRASGTVGSMISISLDGINAGSISLEYRIRKEASWMLKSLAKMGIRTAMVTGDSRKEAERVASILGINEIHAEVLPQEKAQIIRKYQENGDYVLFTGDGINDSVALETADAGISMGSGTDIARESGDIILLNNDLRQIVMARIIGEKTIAKIKQNIGWAVGYNTLLIPVAAGILVPIAGLSIYSIVPMFSALAMGMSSTSVVLNSLFLRNKIGKAWNSINEKMKNSPGSFTGAY